MVSHTSPNTQAHKYKTYHTYTQTHIWTHTNIYRHNAYIWAHKGTGMYLQNGCGGSLPPKASWFHRHRVVFLLGNDGFQPVLDPVGFGHWNMNGGDLCLFWLRQLRGQYTCPYSSFAWFSKSDVKCKVEPSMKEPESYHLHGGKTPGHGKCLH